MVRQIVTLLASILILVLVLKGEGLQHLQLNATYLRLAHQTHFQPQDLLFECIGSAYDSAASTQNALADSTGQQEDTAFNLFDYRLNIASGIAQCTNDPVNQPKLAQTWHPPNPFDPRTSRRSAFFAGAAHFFNGEFESAATYFDEVPHVWRFLHAQALTSMASGAWEAALQWEAMSAHADPNLTNVPRLASMYLDMGRIDLATEAWQPLLDTLPPNSEEYWLVSARQSSTAGNLDDTFDFLKRGLEMASQQYPFYEQLGLHERNRGNDQDALDYFMLSIEARPDYPFGYLYAGDAAFALGNIESARTFYAKAIDIAPHSQTIQTRVSEFQAFVDG